MASRAQPPLWRETVKASAVRSTAMMVAIALYLAAIVAVIALAIVTTAIVNSGRARYAPVTLLPMLFVGTTTTTAAYYEITNKFLPMTRGAEAIRGWLNIGFTVLILACAAVILGSAILRSVSSVRSGGAREAEVGA